jgi:hypothetical protein
MTPAGFSIFDDMGAVTGTISPTITSHGSNKFEFAFSGRVPFSVKNLDKFRVELGLSIYATAEDTSKIHRASFDNTASYSLSGATPDAIFTAVPEPGSTTLLALTSLVAINRRQRR